jgi:hypothetical protein
MIVVGDGDGDTLRRVERELRRRYGADLPSLDRTELLTRVAPAFPHAKRGLLVDFGAWGTSRRPRRSCAPSPSGASTTTC